MTRDWQLIALSVCMSMVACGGHAVGSGADAGSLDSGTVMDASMDAECVDGICHCAVGSVSCGGACRTLASFQTDSENCGSCGSECDIRASQVCVGGFCRCGSDRVLCDGVCRELRTFETDVWNCGACGVGCDPFTGEVCSAGECVCPTGGLRCDGVCVDAATLESDVNNCGACGASCDTSIGELCRAGVCECPVSDVVCDGACRSSSYFENDGFNCGACGAACGSPCDTHTCVAPRGVVASHYYSCVILANGHVQCWGLSLPFYPEPERPAPLAGLTDVVELAGGRRHRCARSSDGSVSCGGANESGQLGDGTYVAHADGGPVTGITNAAQVVVGADHSCARLTDGTVRCWGLNDHGQIGDGSTLLRVLPTVVSGLSGAVQLAAGKSHTCALLTDGTVRCWGLDAAGQLGDDDRKLDIHTPVQVAGLSDALEIVAGDDFTCARSVDGSVWCWGDDGQSQLGDGAFTDSGVPLRAELPGRHGTMTQLAAGGATACAVFSDGSVGCWGSNRSRVFGTGSSGSFFFGVTVGIANPVQLSVGVGHACAYFADASAQCWGNNAGGQLGDGTRMGRGLPAPSFW